MDMRHFVLSCALTLSLLTSCQRSESVNTPEAASPPTKEPAEATGVVRLSPAALRSLTLKIAPVERRPLTEDVRVTAVIKPNENRLAHVGPRIAGRVVEVRKLLGDTVKEGDVLAVLDSVELGKAKADYLKFQALTSVQEKNYQRARRLFEQQISSQKEVLEAEAAYLSAKAEFEAAHATLHLYGLSNKDTHRLTWQAKEPISQFPLRSPFSGIVAEKDLTIGEVMSPERSVYTIADLSTLWIQLDVYEKDLAKVQVGQDVGLTTESYPQENFHGSVTYIGSLLNEATRTALARVEIPNPQGLLKPGMFATAIISAQEHGATAGLIIQESAVQRVEEETVVFISRGDGMFSKRRVVLGKKGDGWVEIREGMQEGEQVVTEGSFTLKSELLKASLAGEE
ncbi:MAG: efflux RND transporter periplasmic adaptor subunit [Deltaproteobacteria bacterium]|nr:efflux RND transporter periplasmic adaptor subunit [Deltaproteobacteria bacterium]